MSELITTEFPFIKKRIFIAGFHQLQITETSFKAPTKGFRHFRALGFCNHFYKPAEFMAEVCLYNVIPDSKKRDPK